MNSFAYNPSQAQPYRTSVAGEDAYAYYPATRSGPDNPATGMPDWWTSDYDTTNRVKYALNTRWTSAGELCDPFPGVSYMVLAGSDGRPIPCRFVETVSDSWSYTAVLIQPISPGVFARWAVSFPTMKPWVAANFTLIRFEGPGFVHYPGEGHSEQYARIGGVFAPQYREWIWQSILSTPRKIGDVWVDGGGVPYGRETASGWEVAIIDVWTVPRSAEFRNESAPAYRGERLVQFADAKLRDPSTWIGIVYGNEYFSGRDKLRGFDDAKILAMSPSDVVSLYYGLGKWENIQSSRYPRYTSPIMTVNGTAAAIYEYELRDRIYLLRKDLWNVKMADGTTIRGLVPYWEFPPLDGKVNTPNAGGHGFFQKIVGVIDSTLATATVVGAVAYYAAKGIELADAMKKAESMRAKSNALLALQTDLVTGAKQIVAMEGTAPTSGDPAKASESGSGGLPWPLILLGLASLI